jgi:protoporphyrinogen oxidase
MDRPLHVIIGAGPAGLTAAYELARHNHTGIILEAEDVVGGIARTVECDGYRFDIGGHRFFTKVKEIEALWDEMLQEPMLTRPRLSRIFYGGRFYDYPLKARNALRNMGLFTAALCMVSYAKARLRPIDNPANFQEWVTNQFGAKLFGMFFKSYTEKVWGCPCTEIGADWAAQRIKGLSLGEAVRNALFGAKKGQTVTTLIDEFKYPRHGPGQLWEACARTLQEKGWDLRMRTRVTGLEVANGRATAIHTQRADGGAETFDADHVFSSMPLRTLLHAMNPAPPRAVVEAAAKLAYRDFLTVALVLDRPNLFPDNWIYVHSADVRVGRVQNYGNWSPEMVPDPTTSCLGLEYFVFEGDDLWGSPDDRLIQLAYQELEQIGLAGGKLLRGYVVRVPKAYPVYDPGYKERLDTIRAWLRANVENLHCIGRNGQHRYNNQDHSMATALIAARNVARAESRDPWAVNEDAEYHEIAETERSAPTTPLTREPA